MRRVFNVAAIISLLLCIGTVALWVRAQFVSDWVQRIYDVQSDSNSYGLRRAVCFTVVTTPPRLIVARWHCLVRLGQGPGYRRRVAKSGEAGWELPRFTGWIGREGANTNHQEWVSLPFWFLTLMFAAVFILTYSRWRLRTKPGCCPKCNYDLRATPDRCPECGTVPAAKIKNPK